MVIKDRLVASRISLKERSRLLNSQIVREDDLEPVLLDNSIIDQFAAESTDLSRMAPLLALKDQIKIKYNFNGKKRNMTKTTCAQLNRLISLLPDRFNKAKISLELQNTDWVEALLNNIVLSIIEAKPRLKLAELRLSNGINAGKIKPKVYRFLAKRVLKLSLDRTTLSLESGTETSTQWKCRHLIFGTFSELIDQ